MSSGRPVALMMSATVVLLVSMHGPGALAASSVSTKALESFAQAWANVQSYSCVVSFHEVDGSHVQDRVMRVTFEKPYNTRVDVLAGDGRGAVIIWRGGDTVHGHEGGWLSAFKSNVDLHDRRVTTLRGETVADANWGALYTHLTTLHADAVQAVVVGDTTTITYQIPDPPGDGNVTKEVLMLGGNSLPIEYDAYVGDQLVAHVTTSDVKLNINPPQSTWSL